MEQETMTTAEVLAELDIKRWQLWDLRQAGHITPCRRVGRKGHMHFRRADVLALKQKIEHDFCQPTRRKPNGAA